jgi:hypothetical protein
MGLTIVFKMRGKGSQKWVIGNASLMKFMTLSVAGYRLFSSGQQKASKCAHHHSSVKDSFV